MDLKTTPQRPTQFLYRLFRQVMPLSRQQVQRWIALAEKIPNHELRDQALSSLRNKRFHADGGAVYAAAHGDQAATLTELIVALQTISDYLDNLCDRCERYDQTEFHLLHDSMRAAVNPGAPTKAYYALRGNPDDGGYLTSLVTTCQDCIRQLPHYDVVQQQVNWYIERYCELQEQKHIEPWMRTQTLVCWSQPYVDELSDVYWWEFAAATGSTLGIFSLFLAASLDVDEEHVKQMRDAYFPWICGLHILLDYLIDLDEDAVAGDFNFVACYPDARTARQRIRRYAMKSRDAAKKLQIGGRIHAFVVKGLLAMYFSDAKVRRQKAVRRARRMLLQFGPTTWLFYLATQLYRVVR